MQKLKISKNNNYDIMVIDMFKVRGKFVIHENKKISISGISMIPDIRFRTVKIVSKFNIER
ncbi:hypothetical protein DRP04_11600 [Archaeoglobales archaeon]|nr:MAG: hypothetical protein DRP04_11600 [Archaeoglobales archaeon]